MPKNKVKAGDKELMRVKPALSNKDKMIVALPAILCDGDEFSPSKAMINFAALYVQALAKQPFIKPLQVVRDTRVIVEGTYYRWLCKPGFQKWLDKVQKEYFETTGLSRVHKAIYDNALSNSQADRKLFVERFDQDYKPQTGQEHTFKGYAPPEEQNYQAALERSKDRFKLVQSKQLPGGADVSPDIIESNNNMEHNNNYSTEQTVGKPQRNDEKSQ